MTNTITFREITDIQIEEVLKYLDNLSPYAIEWLLGWTEGDHSDWIIEYDLQRWAKGNFT